MGFQYGARSLRESVPGISTNQRLAFFPEILQCGIDFHPRIFTIFLSGGEAQTNCRNCKIKRQRR